MSLRMGIDIGGTNILSGILNEKDRIIVKHSVSIKGACSEQEVLERVRSCAEAVCEKAGIMPENITSVGIGSPGALNKEAHIICHAANLPFHHTFLGDVLAPAFRARVRLINDANAAAFGEAMQGTGSGSSSFVMLTLGTGVGGGIVIDGKLYDGCNGLAGELGHMIIERNGRICRCGQRGCLEAYASADALIRDTKAAMCADKKSLMWEMAGTLDEVDGKIPFEAKRRGDTTALKVIEAYSRNLAYGITNMIQILQPEVISIGGGISGQGEYLLAPVRKLVYSRIKPSQTSKIPKLCIAKLGADAGMIGAAMLGGREMEQNWMR